MFARLDIITDRERRRAHVIVPYVLESRVEPILNPVTGEEHRARIVSPTGLNTRKRRLATRLASRSRCRRNSQCTIRILTRSLTLLTGATSDTADLKDAKALLDELTG